MSTNCIPDEKCHDRWIWVTTFLMAIVYLIWYMYSQELMNLAPKLVKTIVKRMKNLVCRAKRLVAQNVVNVVRNHNKLTKAQCQGKLKSLDSVNSNYLGILTYYINISSLLKVNVVLLNEIQIPTIWENVKYYFVAFINLDIFSLSYDTCPTSSMTTVSKALFKMLIVVFIFLVWLFTYITVLIIRKFKYFRKLNSLKSLKYSLIEGFIETQKFSYSLKAGTVFYFLTCVQAGSKYRWLYDGTLECYSSWQNAVIVYLVYDVIPFPVMLIAGIFLVREVHISAQGFIIASFFPLPMLIYWTIMYTVRWRKVRKPKGKQLSGACTTILDSLQGPYREQGLIFGWEGIIEFRKLVFNLLTLVPNDVLRLTIGGFGCTLAFGHHIIVRPFKGVKDNLVESVSLGLLIMHAICHLSKAVLSDFGITPESHSWNERLFQVLDFSEYVYLAALLIFIILLKLCNLERETEK